MVDEISSYHMTFHQSSACLWAMTGLKRLFGFSHTVWLTLHQKWATSVSSNLSVTIGVDLKVCFSAPLPKYTFLSYVTLSVPVSFRKHDSVYCAEYPSNVLATSERQQCLVNSQIPFRTSFSNVEMKWTKTIDIFVLNISVFWELLLCYLIRKMLQLECGRAVNNYMGNLLSLLNTLV